MYTYIQQQKMQSLSLLAATKDQAVKAAIHLNNVLVKEFPLRSTLFWECNMDFIWFNFEPNFAPTKENAPAWWSACTRNKMPYVYVGIRQEHNCYAVSVRGIYVEAEAWPRLKGLLNDSLTFDGMESKPPTTHSQELFDKYNKHMKSGNYSPEEIQKFLTNPNRKGFVTDTSGKVHSFRMDNICAYCNAGYGNNKPFPPTGKGLCGRCKQVQYCSRECQKAHWPTHKKTCKKQKKRYKKELKKYGKSTKKATVLKFKDKEEFEEWKRENNKDIEFVEAVNIPVTEEQRASMQTTKLLSKISSHRVVPEDVMRFSDKEKEDVRKKILPMVDDKVKELRKKAAVFHDDEWHENNDMNDYEGFMAGMYGCTREEFHKKSMEDISRFFQEEACVKIQAMVRGWLVRFSDKETCKKQKAEPARQECPVPQEYVEEGNLIGAMAGLSVEDGDFLHASEQLKELANNPNRVAELLGHCNTREDLLRTVAGVLAKSKK